MTYPTYKDLCINVLLRLGEDRSIENGRINRTSSVTSYLKAMPMLLRDALNLLATAGKYVTGTVTITQAPGEAENGPLVGSAVSVSEPQANWRDSAQAARVSRVAAHDNKGVSAETAVSVGNKNLYDLRELEPDFYSLGMVKFVGPDGGYESAGDWGMENGHIFVVPAAQEGIWYLNVNLYPQEIPDDIADETVLKIDPEVYLVLPLFIEGKLRLINDEDYATTVLNEFEQRRDELLKRTRANQSAAVYRDGVWAYD